MKKYVGNTNPRTMTETEKLVFCYHLRNTYGQPEVAAYVENSQKYIDELRSRIRTLEARLSFKTEPI